MHCKYQIPKALRYAPAALLVLLCSACNHSVTIQGCVKDVQKNTLPGVAVSVLGSENEAITTGVGAYTLAVVPGPLELVFIKSGYTTGHMTLDATGNDAINDAILWPLPPGKGVFLFEDFKYRDTTRAEPKRYIAKDTGPIMGTKIEPETATLTESPMIVCHKLPSYDLHLYRLDIRDAALSLPGNTPPNEKNKKVETLYSEKIWAPVDNIPVVATPIDEPEQTLFDIHPATSLEPGTYAVHWGALDGHSTTEPHIYLFKIAAPEPAPTNVE